MSKSDFEFVRLPDLYAELVIPKARNDTYAGALSLHEGMFATHHLEEIVTNDQPYPYTLDVITGESDRASWGFHERMLSERQPEMVYREHADVKIDVPLEAAEEADGWELDVAGIVYNNVCRAPRTLVPPQVTAESLGVSEARFAAITEGLTFARSNPETFLFTGNTDGLHVSPSIKYANVIDLTAYRWLPGPRRVTYREDTSPTYNPRPSSLVVMSTVTIEFVNPLVAENPDETEESTARPRRLF